MSILSKLIIAIAIATAVSQAYAYWIKEAFPNLELLGIFCLATVLTVIFGAFRLKRRAENSTIGRSTNSRKRTEGTVKWFNGSKGFGFITIDNGDEIFVHFRSIQGRGRRVLRDGQKVTLIVTDSDKGPQAEDVQIV